MNSEITGMCKIGFEFRKKSASYFDLSNCHDASKENKLNKNIHSDMVFVDGCGFYNRMYGPAQSLRKVCIEYETNQIFMFLVNHVDHEEKINM